MVVGHRSFTRQRGSGGTEYCLLLPNRSFYAPQIAIRGDGAAIIASPTDVGFPPVSVNGQVYSIPSTRGQNWPPAVAQEWCALLVPLHQIPQMAQWLRRQMLNNRSHRLTAHYLLSFVK